MDEARIGENAVGIDGDHGLARNGSNVPEFMSSKVYKQSPNLIMNLAKFSLLVGAEKVLMARKSQQKAFSCSSLSSWTHEEAARENRRKKGKSVLQDEKLGCGTSRNSATESSIDHFDMPKVVNSYHNTEFFFDFTAFFAVMMLKLVGFQINLLVRLFTFPISLMNFWTMVLTLPFQTLTFVKDNLKRQLINLWSKSWFSLMSFVFSQIKAQKSLLKLTVRFCWAMFWAVYVLFMLVGLLVMGFVISGLTMRRLLEEPIETTKPLNFDYTKTSPVAFVPLTNSPLTDLSTSLISKPKTNIADRPIPYNHKLQVIVALTMPESEYNRKLGIFQVRVDCLSADGKVTATSSYPSMLKFKSQPIRIVETAIKSIPLVTGFQSEVQNLKVVISDFTEGFEPTACFKVVLEKRAEYQPEGAGIPEIYVASLHVESELPQIKRIIWIWRRTVFVWIGILLFLTQLSFALIFCRPVLLPGRRLMTVLGTKRNAQKNKISW